MLLYSSIVHTDIWAETSASASYRKQNPTTCLKVNFKKVDHANGNCACHFKKVDRVWGEGQRRVTKPTTSKKSIVSGEKANEE